MDTDLGFRFLIIEMSGFEFSPYHKLPSAHRGFHPAALIVAGGFPPGLSQTFSAVRMSPLRG
jgi:hypothetical protein